MAIFDGLTTTTTALGTTAVTGWVSVTPTTTSLIDYSRMVQAGMLQQQSAFVAPQKKVKAGPPVKLERKALPEVTAGEPVKAARRQLAKLAQDLLGYGHLQENLTKVEQDAAAKARVSEVFTKLGIEPLDAAKVDAYKAQKVSEVTNSYFVGAWQSYALCTYTRPVPEFALSRACEIKREIPDAQFFVEELVQNRIDPFLVMRYGNEVHYLDVWDEPGFEGRRTV